MKVIRQKDAMDCGLTCLAMVVEFYGKTSNLNDILKSCSLSKDGVSLLAISKTAELMGFKTIGGSFIFNRIAEEILLPCIIH